MASLPPRPRIHFRRSIDTRTNIVLNDERVKEALKYSNAKTKRELVERALQEFVANRKRKDARDLIGKVKIDPNYDYKTLRTEQN